MHPTRFPHRLSILVLVCCSFAAAAPNLFAQLARPPEKPAPVVARPLHEFLRSPRETLKTLYFAGVAYDLRPQLMDEALACLDLDPARGIETAEATRLVIELEQILRILCVPIHGVPEKTERDAVALLDGDGFKITLVRGPDGLWRFDRDTVERIPTMNRAALARFRMVQAERSTLKEEYTDPSATMRRFHQDALAGDFYAAARSLDLSWMDSEERSDKGPLLARQLAFVMQRRGWLFLQEVPNHPNGPTYTWHADKAGRIALDRLRLPDGKEAWLFNKKTVRNIPVMYEQAKDQPADPRYVRLGKALDPLTAAADPALSRTRPGTVPAHLGSPRALLQGFFRVMDAAETSDAKLVEALEYLDLQAIPQVDRRVQGAKVAVKLDAVLRKLCVELSALPDDWNAPQQTLGENAGVAVQLARQRDGCWRFSQGTVAQVPAFFDKLAGKDRTENDRAAHLDSARDTITTFLSCMRQGDYERAADCLDLSLFRTGSQDEVGPVLAYKLKYVMDRIGRVYVQEVPDTAEGPPYVFYRGDIGRIVLSRRADGPRKGTWLFTPETVVLIEPMFRAVFHQPVDAANRDSALGPPSFWQTPGIWVRLYVPAAFQTVFWRLHLYQWLGLALAVAVSGLVCWLLLAQVHRLVVLLLHKSGSALTRPFVAARLRPLTWVTAWWLLFQVLTLLDLPSRFVDAVLPLRTFGMAGLIAWLGMQIVDLVTAVYMNSELLRPHRSLSDMIVPVSMRSLKGVILLLVSVYVVYQFGEGESLNRFLTGLGVAGLAVSLAAQDTLKSFFSTLLLIGERSFKIGDKIAVGGQEGVVEQVGFRSTRLRTADGSLLTLPNSTLTAAAIDNRSTKAFSRCTASLLVNYDTAPERILALRDHLKLWLMDQPHVRQDKVEVTVHRLSEKGVEVCVDLYLTDVDSTAEKRMKEEINCTLLRLCEGLGSREVNYRHPLADGEKAQADLLAGSGAA
jgi:MscS family membrane protein